MNWLGVNWGHPCTAAIFSDGKILAAAAEERFSRLKNDMSFPVKAIKYCLSNKALGQLDGVGIVSLEMDYPSQLYHDTTWPVEEHIRQQHQVWYPRLYEGKEVDDVMVFPNRWVHQQYPLDYWAEYDPLKKTTFTEDSAQILADHLNLPRSKVLRIEHHLCHAYYGYYASPYRSDRAVVITVDGYGDGLNATVSIAHKNTLERIYATDTCVLGRIYRHITLLLGMKPLEHEYKVMGLAPYAKEKDALRAYKVFSELIQVKGIEFLWKNRPKDSYFYFRDKLEGLRFDHIAAGLQKWVEEMLCQWVANIVSHTQIDTVVISGGVAMNVKAMGKIAALDCVKRFFVPGTASDDSTCIGAAIAAALNFSKNDDNQFSITDLFLGPEPGDNQEVFKLAALDPSLSIITDVSDDLIAGLLVQAVVIGRCYGRMEFGQRALGNRSILADPTVPGIVDKINMMIKNRDFWMPFAPVVLDTFTDKYLVNPKNVQSPHMTIGFATTEEGFRCMQYACHPADRTVRAQILVREDNPPFYRLLKAFEKLSGRGALLNTSFNLHGHPIVNTSQDAFKVFKHSELEALLLSEGIILKKHVLERIKLHA